MEEYDAYVSLDVSKTALSSLCTWKHVTRGERKAIPLTVISEDVCDSTSGNPMAQICERAPDPGVSPTWIFSRQPHHKFGNLSHDGWSPSLLPPRTEVPLPRDELAVPSEDNVRCNNGSDFSKNSSTEDLALCRKLSSLVVRKARPLTAELLFGYTVLLDQVADHSLLMPVDPTSYSEEEEFPRLVRSAHEQGL